MAPIKRKQLHDEPKGRLSTTKPTITRRTTRQTSVTPLPIPEDPEPRKRRRRIDANEQPKPIPTAANGAASKRPKIPAHPLQEKENVHPRRAQPPSPPKRRQTRQNATNIEPVALGSVRKKDSAKATNFKAADIKPLDVNPRPVKPEPANPESVKPAIFKSGNLKREVVKPGSGKPGNDKQGHVKPPVTSTPRPASAVPIPRLPPRASITPKRPSISSFNAQHAVQQSRRLSITTTAAPGHSPARPRPTIPTPPSTERASPGPDRNIDKVVLGDVCFRAWYPSYYGKEVLGDLGSNSNKLNVGPHVNGDAREDGSSKPGGTGRRERDHSPMLDRLYVCPCCFKYSKELVLWWEHVRVCQRRSFVPGTRIYLHPRGKRTVRVPPATAPAKAGRKKAGDNAPKVVEKEIRDEGEWSIWEVDGEKDVLFCQNLSLFAKLFLDNKSVFFDVMGFNYFLLVYTLPATSATGGGGSSASEPAQRHQIVGFFSKEKMSWDNNNLACILVFPPWQRKGLGALLMCVSYEISRREGILGGPEKPISDLGKKGYKRFWAGEIARWILGTDLSAPTLGGAVVVSVEECSKATWIAQDDCLLVLREMGVVQDAGMGPPRAATDAVQEDTEGEVEAQETKQIQRVQISKDAVRAWVAASGVALEQSCDPDGFVEGYAMPTAPEAAEE